MDCVTELPMPYVTPGVLMNIPATIPVRITVGKNGRASEVEYGDVKPIVRLELDWYFKRDARYKPACAGRTITFTVRYLLEGVPTPFLVSRVLFRPPSEFVVVAHPIQPSLDGVRETPK